MSSETRNHVAALTEMLSEERRMLVDLPQKATAALLWRRGQAEKRIAALEAAIEVLGGRPS